MRKIQVATGDIASALAAARYPLDKNESPEAYVAAGYRLKESELAPQAVWLGSERALAVLGLERGQTVAEGDLAQALQGLNVVSGRRVRREGNMERSVVDDEGNVVRGADLRPVTETVRGCTSMDLTFSAPKSVSIAWSQAPPAQRADIERAVMHAANATWEHLLQTRDVVVNKGKREPAKGMAVAAALHVTARRAEGELAPSPQLHVHGVLVGLERSDGKFRAADSWAMFRDDAALEAGAVGRAVLAHELVNLGYNVQAGTGRDGLYFELRGVSEELREAMSGRTRDVRRRREELRAEGRDVREADIAGQYRADKDADLSPEATMREWQRIVTDKGFGPAQAEAMLTHRGYVGSIEDRVVATREGILERLWEHGPTLTVGRLRAHAYAAAPGQVTPEQVRDVLVAMERSGELIALEGGFVTSASIRNMEEEVLRTAVRAGQRGEAGLSADARSLGLKIATDKIQNDLGPDQMEAFETLAGGIGWGVLTGRAGTGKGPTLHALAAAHEADGWDVIACAMEGAIAQRLGEDMDTPAKTLGQVMWAVETGDITLGDRTLLVIDEASKVDLETWAELALWSRKFGVSVLAVGHEGQHGAIQSPGMFSELMRQPGVPLAILTNIRRHIDPANPGEVHPWLRDYQVLVDQGLAVDAVELLVANDAIHLRDTWDQALEAMIADWNSWRENYGVDETALIVHGSNDDVDLVNVRAQKCRIDAGQVTGAGVRAPDRHYSIYTGDLVIVCNGAYRLGPGAPAGPRRVENGQVGIVEETIPAQGLVRINVKQPGYEARSVWLDLKQMRQAHETGEDPRSPSLRLAYSRHSMPFQGATVRRTTSIGGHWAQDKHASYTADTRSREGHSIWLSRQELRAGLGLEADDAALLTHYAQQYMMRSPGRQSSLTRKVDPNVALAHARVKSDGVPSPTVVERAADVRRPDKAAGPAGDRPDLLADYRDVLGDRRADAIDARARELQPSLHDRGVDVLVQWRDRYAEAWEHLSANRHGARRTLVLERDARIAAAEARMAATEAAELDARASELTFVQREAKRQLYERAEVEHEKANRGYVKLKRLRDAEADLRADGRHLDGWMASDGDAAARWLALERELWDRGEYEAEAPEVAPEVTVVAEVPAPDLAP
jgi:conjugative relaxase-like TrwC/TraI family protein